mmetsp:Transcript_53372/g.157940  ORF Transcript_53372/g.157940 Transcript_53372/m.157940 type:complete len:107 (+) Transcript_53372:665-985(+)
MQGEGAAVQGSVGSGGHLEVGIACCTWATGQLRFAHVAGAPVAATRGETLERDSYERGVVEDALGRSGNWVVEGEGFGESQSALHTRTTRFKQAVRAVDRTSVCRV